MILMITHKNATTFLSVPMSAVCLTRMPPSLCLSMCLLSVCCLSAVCLTRMPPPFCLSVCLLSSYSLSHKNATISLSVSVCRPLVGYVSADQLSVYLSTVRPYVILTVSPASHTDTHRHTHTHTYTHTHTHTHRGV